MVQFEVEIVVQERGKERETTYSGEPQSVSAISSGARARANPKSAIFRVGGGEWGSVGVERRRF